MKCDGQYRSFLSFPLLLFLVFLPSLPSLSPLVPLKRRSAAGPPRLVWLSLSGGKSPPPRDVRAIKKREKKTELFKWSEIDLLSEEGISAGRAVVCGLAGAVSTSVSFYVHSGDPNSKPGASLFQAKLCRPLASRSFGESGTLSANQPESFFSYRPLSVGSFSS